MTRKLIRPSLSELGIAGSSDGRGKKRSKWGAGVSQGLPVPRKRGEPVLATIILADGEEVRGRIEWHDRDCIKVERPGKPSLLIMRHAIKYISHKPLPRGGRQE